MNRLSKRRGIWPLVAAMRTTCVLLGVMQACASQSGRFVWIDDLTETQAPSPTGNYVVGVGDVLGLQVFSHPEMAGRTRVSEDGRVAIALLGDVPATGKAPEDLAREIEKQLEAIDVSDFVGHKVRAMAAYRSQYPIDPGMFPDPIIREMFGVEYFIQVLPEPELRSSLLDE